MMNILFKYCRIGAFMIDMAIVQMFTQLAHNVFIMILKLLALKRYLILPFSNNLALPLLLFICVILLLIFTGLFVIYHWICFRCLGVSLGKWILGLNVMDTNGYSLSLTSYTKREYEKVALFTTSLTFYGLYSIAQFITFSREPLHGRRSNSVVSFNKDIIRHT
ncbi:RDD family protein [Salmonella enterica]|nr:RDD family protein [Salmonella enterica]